MQTRPRSTIGAAMTAKLLPEYADWLIEDQRDLEIQDPISTDVLDGDWRPLVRQIRNTLDGYSGRMGIHGPFLSLTILGYDPKARALVVERFRQGLEIAAELGATHMVIHSPFIFFGAPFLAHAPSNGLAEQIKVIQATLEEVVTVAEQAQCMLAIENVLDTNPAPLRTLVQSFQSDFVRMSLDTGHAFITHTRGGPPPDQWVREAGALLGHMHVQDSDGNLDRHWAPEDGNINWHALFEALAELEHQPRLLLELRNPQEIKRGAAYFVQRGFAR